LDALLNTFIICTGLINFIVVVVSLLLLLLKFDVIFLYYFVCVWSFHSLCSVVLHPSQYYQAEQRSIERLKKKMMTSRMMMMRRISAAGCTILIDRELLFCQFQQTKNENEKLACDSACRFFVATIEQ
jgi:hypothetical protein